jgi:hypothetical protein
MNPTALECPLVGVKRWAPQTQKFGGTVQ